VGIVADRAGLSTRAATCAARFSGSGLIVLVTLRVTEVPEKRADFNIPHAEREEYVAGKSGCTRGNSLDRMTLFRNETAESKWLPVHDLRLPHYSNKVDNKYPVMVVSFSTFWRIAAIGFTLWGQFDAYRAFLVGKTLSGWLE
jgi:hypothetical protein